MQICQAELFGPAVAIAPYDTLDEAIELANSTSYGLQASIFTSNLKAALYAAERLDFGGVHVNEVSSYRADHMPYGGVKASGMGREGPRYAIEEMSETKHYHHTNLPQEAPPIHGGEECSLPYFGLWWWGLQTFVRSP